MKWVAVLIVAIAAVGLIALYYAGELEFLLNPTAECNYLNPSCMDRVNKNVIDCIPTTQVVEGANGVKIKITIRKEGDKCIVTQEIIDAASDEDKYLIGYKLDCNRTIGLNESELYACNGSLMEYFTGLSPAGKVSFPGGGGGGAQPESGNYYCREDDSECKTSAMSALEQCNTCVVVNVEKRWDPDGYWTQYVSSAKSGDNCSLYFQILNAINLPPGEPASVIGLNMTCQIPMENMGSSTLTSEWCSGTLYNYLYPNG